MTEVIKDLYNAGSDISRMANKDFLGDRTNRSICRQTTHGIKDTFKISDEEASDIVVEQAVHTGIYYFIAFIISKEKELKIFALLILAVLIYFYYMGSKRFAYAS